MIEILYDVAVLGLGLKNERARTGVYRVVENIAKGINQNKEINVRFCSTSNWLESVEYLKLKKNFNDEKFVYPDAFKTFVLNIQSKLLKQEKLLASACEQAKSGTKKKAYFYSRRVVYKSRKILSSQAGINNKILRNTDIFHSPFGIIPDEIKSYKKITRFLTVYDLIPILYPQYFQFQENHLVKQAIQSLGEDGWAFCISHATKQDLCNYININPERVIVTHLAAAADKFYKSKDKVQNMILRKKYGIPEGHYFLSLCTLEPRKNIDHVIRCFAKIVKEQHLKDVHLVLVGTKGWDFDKIFNEITKDVFVKSRIIVTGFVDDKDLAAIYSDALCFVYTSFYEGFGLPPLEAMQCGVPVITSNTSSLPEVVGEAGITVGPQDADALCQAMLKVYHDESLRMEMSDKSLNQSAQFSWSKCVHDTISGYKKACFS